jgi:translation initiation factor 2-alpha kinase 4
MKSGSGQFAALGLDTDSDDSSSSSHEDSHFASAAPSTNDDSNVEVPSFEDLSISCADEVTVLTAIYADDFKSEKGTWGQKKLNVRVKPPDLEPKQIGCHATLVAQIPKQYPYAVPKIKLQDVKGLSKSKNKFLIEKLNQRAVELSKVGSVMVCELVQIVEDFLLEHNVDPSMSEWENMKAREAKEQSEKEELERARDKQIQTLMDAENSTGVNDQSIPSNNNSGSLEIEKELARQREAIEVADKYRMKKNGIFEMYAPIESSNTSNSGVEDNSENEDDDFDDDDTPPSALFGSSRYHTDFVELGILGRGGGGEVVKVKNRLDRRIYAIKKILLENGKDKFGEMQNKKLRREVTTISSVMHKNIVRYYQAWVEGNYSTDESVLDDDAVIDKVDTTEDILKAKLDDDSEEGDGWWENPTKDDEKRSSSKNEGLRRSSKSSSGSGSFEDSSSTSWSDEDEGQLDNDKSMDRLFPHNFNFQNQTYEGLFKNEKNATIVPGEEVNDGRSADGDNENGSDLWDESSVKVDHTKKQSILYIQMEYCNTTLRKLIDENAISEMSQSDVWRLVRQIVEALVYIHSRRIIHRDLVSKCKCSVIESWQQ